MSRNRMRNSQSLHWMGVLKWILIAGLLAGLGLCYMLCKNQNLHLAEETHLLQQKLDGINQANEDYAAGLHRMKSFTLLDRRLKMMHSTLVAWGDPSASWMRLDLNTRARLVREGTPVKSPINLNSLNSGSAPVASATLPPLEPAHT
jgi:hypothetical protein